MNTHIKLWTFDALAPELALKRLALPGAAGSLDEVSASLPGGAYTTLRTYAGNCALKLGDHLARLSQTARLTGTPLPLVETVMREALRQAVTRYWEGISARGDLRIRISVDLEEQPGRAYIAAQPLVTPPAELYERGAAAVTVRMGRLLPEAKLTRFIERSREARKLLSPEVNEALMVNPQEELTEGLTSNFFAVLDGQLRTAAEGVLKGVTRGLALECAESMGFPVRFEPVHMHELPRMEEAFLTSSSRGILPLRRIDEVEIGRECPGKLTRALAQAFSELIGRLIEPV